ncbi:hypothetical protein Vretimale_2939 [Volvox reticuliferus]|uniref:Methyltransferase type 11 domain-containing protein n=1 Tax=Volvox reticuliferus TaxID=1737510 RepID=A0A8J4DCA9_9CHLO|nr:hypothetical protein Vretifemale_6954 [Volvox reticuliferus]GIL97195.1 hypothetical protein Vretimale_2939 [Volvox reticuliferus]
MSSVDSGLNEPEPNLHTDPTQLFLDAQQTSHYARHRPHYPQQLYHHLYGYAFPGRQPPFPDLTVVDVATGSGQSLGPLPCDFGTCIALDVSTTQLAEVPPTLRQRVRLQLGDAHATGLPPASVDLVTVGQALHWFRLDDFYKECCRILRPTGALAAWTYDFGQLHGFNGAEELYRELHSGILGSYWAKGRELVDRYYIGIEPGPEYFEEVQRLQLPMPVSVTLDELVGQVRSWSGYASFLRMQPSRADPAEWFRQQCAACMAMESVERLTLQRTITMLIALRPRLRGV